MVISLCRLRTALEIKKVRDWFSRQSYNCCNDGVEGGGAACPWLPWSLAGGAVSAGHLWVPGCDVNCARLITKQAWHRLILLRLISSHLISLLMFTYVYFTHLMFISCLLSTLADILNVHVGINHRNLFKTKQDARTCIFINQHENTYIHTATTNFLISNPKNRFVFPRYHVFSSGIRPALPLHPRMQNKNKKETNAAQQRTRLPSQLPRAPGPTHIFQSSLRHIKCPSRCPYPVVKISPK